MTCELIKVNASDILKEIVDVDFADL